MVPTLDFVPDQFGGLHLSDAAEEAPQLLLRHALRQVVYDQVGLGILIPIPSHVLFITIRHVKHLLQETNNKTIHQTQMRHMWAQGLTEESYF